MPSLWRRLSDRDRRIFLARLARYWEVHRHLIPPATAARVDELRRTGRLVIHRGRIRTARPSGHGLSVDMETGPGAIELTASWLINATGGRSDITTTPSPLLRQILASGLARPDPLRLGIEAAAGGAVIGASGHSSDFLFTLGPPLRGLLYETTAIPEIRSQAAEIGAQIAARLDRQLQPRNAHGQLRAARSRR